MGTGETYSVNCVHCTQTFDALEAEWCSCLTTERTLACPHCGKCFCRGPAAYKRTFWSAAPKALWDRKFEEHNRGFEKPPPENPDDLKRPLVLIVDDERDIRRIATRGVEGLGYGVLLGENGEEALELARRYRPDLVLTDALMPKMDGRELCKMIKGDPEIKGTKVVVMTSLYTGVKYQNEGFKNFHVDDYIAKPLEFDKLKELLQKHLA
jgi:CheY-like chemotaxis protein